VARDAATPTTSECVTTTERWGEYVAPYHHDKSVQDQFFVFFFRLQKIMLGAKGGHHYNPPTHTKNGRTIDDAPQSPTSFGLKTNKFEEEEISHRI